MNPIKVLIIEPDALSRLAIVSMLKSSAQIVVVGIASDAMQARMQVKLRQPDALILATDQQADAVNKFLLELMQSRAMAVLMLSNTILPSSHGERQALRAGGAILAKPSSGIQAKDQRFCDQLIQHIQRVALQVKSADVATAQRIESSQSSTLATPASSTAAMRRHNPVLDKLLLIGASTGGTEALRRVVAEFPADLPAVAIVQHIPKAFASAFIQKLDRASAMTVVAATDGAEIFHGHIYIGACDEHFRIEKQGMALVCRVGGKQKISGHCPSVNELFDSAAQQIGSKAVAVLMTGMGDDGATGLKKMRQARAITVVQDKASSVVWGMPGAAVKLDAVEFEVGLNEMAEKLIQLVR